MCHLADRVLLNWSVSVPVNDLLEYTVNRVNSVNSRQSDKNNYWVNSVNSVNSPERDTD